MQPTIPQFTTAPELGREAGVTVHTVNAALRKAGIEPDGILSAGRSTVPLFALSRVQSLVEVVNGRGAPLEAVV